MKERDIKIINGMMKEIEDTARRLNFLTETLSIYLEGLEEEDTETFMEYCKRDIKAEEDIKNGKI